MSLPPPRTSWTAAVVATLVMSVSYVDRQTLAVLAPTVRAALGISRAEYGWLVGSFSVAYLVTAPFAGAWIDRVGARRGLVAAVLAWSAVAASTAFVPGIGALFAVRIALGVTEAPSFPGGVQTIRRVLPPENRSAGFGLLFTGSSIGATIAAPLATRVYVATSSWRIAFVGAALVGLAWIPVWLAITSRPTVRAALDAIEPPAPSVVTSGTRVALLRHGAVLRGLLLVVATAPSIMFGLNWSSQYLVDTFGLKQGSLDLLLAVPPIFFDLGAVVFGWLASRRDRTAPPGEKRTHAPLVLAAACLSTAMAFMPLAGAPWPATILAALSLAGGGGLFALLTGDMLARVDARFTSTAGGMCAAAQSLAYIIANPLVGSVVDSTKSYASVLLGLGGIVLPAAIAWSFWPMPRAVDRDVKPA